MADDKSEAYELSRIEASPTKNSGRGAFSKGDGIIFDGEEPMFTVDVKEYAKSFPISQSTWAKISLDAKKNSGSRPMYKIVLGHVEPRTRVIVIDEEMFNMIMEVYWKYGDLSE
jgi:hypothetical protein